MISKEVDTSIVQESASEQSPLTRQIAPKNPMNVKPTIVKRIGALLLALHVQLLPIPQTTAQEATAHESTVIAKGATLTLLADGFKFTEGPTADARGNVYFTDQPNDTIHCWTIEGKLTTFLNPSGRSNGLFMASSGELLACADGNNELWSIDQAGAHIVILTAFEGKKLNGPNDLWLHPDGSIYFTDPYYKRPYWNRGGIEQPGQSVYRMTPDRKSVQRLTEDLRQPNGIIGDSKNKFLYVADIGDQKTFKYTIEEDGSLSHKTLFCTAGSDGMTLDSDRNLYLTGKNGVTRYSADGVLQETIAIPKGWTANVTFGGPNHDTLFITAGDSLFSIKTTVAGCRE